MRYIKGSLIDVQIIDTGTHKLVSLNHIVDLIALLTPDEQEHFQGELQGVIDSWLARKSIDGDEQDITKVLTHTLEELRAVHNTLDVLSERKDIDRHERASILSDMNRIEELKEKYQYYIDAGFIDF